MSDAQRPRIVLASGSATRRRMLADAGVAFEVIPADVDEDGITAQLFHVNSDVLHAEIAEALAREKALQVSSLERYALVIGSDQVLTTGDRIYAKPAGRAAAAEMLRELRGRRHALVSSVAVASDGEVVFQDTDTTFMSMRDFSDDFLEYYLDAEGSAVLSSAGAYRIEGLGAQLFDFIEGDHFNILGMPLLSLLSELRRRGAVPT
ncbi:MAG: nucleoside triphosphate pyrophosphatase [Hyphomicrobium sp.]|nr:nucleoside triphosphate pyrophosphatase [Hyphomicrobium sp.]